MNQDELDNLKSELKISANQVLREEAEMFFLEKLAESKLAERLVFYGGTSLRLAYGSPRFSEDIDLIRLKPIKFIEFEKKVVQIVEQNVNWKLNDIKDKRQTMFAVILIADEKLKHNFSLKIELHKPAGKVSLDKELLLIKSPTSIAEPLLLVPTLEEIRSLKLKALAGRRKARDVFDLWYINRLLKEKFVLPSGLPKYGKREFQNELRVFLPPKYHPVIDQLYEQVASGNKKNS